MVPFVSSRARRWIAQRLARRWNPLARSEPPFGYSRCLDSRPLVTPWLAQHWTGSELVIVSTLIRDPYRHIFVPIKGLDLIAASLIYPYREKLRAGQQRNAPRFGASRVVFKALGHVGCPPRRSHAPALEVRLERGDPPIGRWEIKLGSHRAYTLICSSFMAMTFRDLPIQKRKAKPKELLRTVFSGYLGATGKTPDLLCLEESVTERLHT